MRIESGDAHITAVIEQVGLTESLVHSEHSDEGRVESNEPAAASQDSTLAGVNWSPLALRPKWAGYRDPSPRRGCRRERWRLPATRRRARPGFVGRR
jgi:hypothetical protein